jgi:hypothetical protein
MNRRGFWSSRYDKVDSRVDTIIEGLQEAGLADLECR